MHVHHLQKTISKTVDLGYLVHLPPTYGDGQVYPLILFLHGRGERGSDLELLKLYGLPKLLLNQPDFPFIVVSPQCPTDQFWQFQVEAVRVLLDEILATYAVDKTRVYLTGLSMGGAGTWLLACQYPQYFAAIAPICGEGYVGIVECLVNTPVWAFHGELDTVVLPEKSIQLVNRLKEHGGDARLTLYPDLAHNSGDAAYGTPELYEWLLQHRRA